MAMRLTEQDILDIMRKQTPSKTATQEYPQTDISYDTNKNVYIELAVPGYTKESLKIDVQDTNLVVEGVLAEQTCSSLTYVQRKIEIKAFTRKIHLDPEYLAGEFYADLNDGVLTISVTPKENPKVNIIIN